MNLRRETHETTSKGQNGPTLSLLGCGWLGVALAPALISRGFHVRGSTTRSSKLHSLASLGIEPFLFRIEPETDAAEGHALDLDRFLESDTLLINLPPETALGADYHPNQVSVILDSLAQLPKLPKHIVYVSSTSVYGSQQGSVTEKTEPNPDEGSGSVLLEAERRLAEFARTHRLALSVVRAGGLIGPGRHPGLFLAGRKNATNGTGPVNLIHQMDLVEILVSIVADVSLNPGQTEVYNAVSSRHPSRREFYVSAAQAIGVEPPSFSDEKPSSKLISSGKVRALPGVTLKFDDLYAAMGIPHPEARP